MKKIYLLTSLIIITGTITAQNVGIGKVSPGPDASAQLDVSSTTKGFLPPRMTLTQRNSIVSPAVLEDD